MTVSTTDEPCQTQDVIHPDDAFSRLRRAASQPLPEARPTHSRRHARQALLALTIISVAISCATPDPRSKGQPTMAEEAHTLHTIDYIELTVTDLAEAKRFYAAAFGWSFNDYGPDYAGIKKPGGGEVGGMRQDAEVQRGGPLVVLYSNDLEASESAVSKAGGQIVVEPFSFPGGRRFHFLDPAGNELAVWSEK